MATETIAPEADAAPAVDLLDFHRCDHCGHRSYVAYDRPDAGQLAFCAHHGAVHEPALIAQGFDLIADTRHLLDPENIRDKEIHA